MPDLIKVRAGGWSLNVWSRDIAPAQAQWSHMLDERGRDQRNPGGFLVATDDGVAPGFIEGFDNEGRLLAPVFFENRAYEFEFDFANAVSDVSVSHRLTVVCDSFRFTGKSLRGTLNLANDIGWFRLGLNYRTADGWHHDQVSFEVLPLKMDLEQDMAGIQSDIDATFPLWRFSFGQKTEQEMARSTKPHERFPLLWLSLFAALRNELKEQIRIVCNAPHNRLQPFRRVLPMDRIRGKMSRSLEEKVGEAIASKNWEKKFAVEAMRLSVDTPENRFVKMVLVTSSRRIAGIAEMARLRNRAPDQQQISQSFFDQLGAWQKELDIALANPLFAEVGAFDGLERESLVLHHRAGYAGVYRVWQQLKQYLDVLGRDADISMKSVAELYEVWCLLEVRKQLCELGFEEQIIRGARLQTDHSGLEVMLQDRLGPAFLYTREDGVSINLAHEPVFCKPRGNSDSIYSWTVNQKPDIVLEAEFRGGEKLLWVFDAKYRIADSNGGPSPDMVPEDAINQMHRYRDALVYRSREEKSRPVVGAFALYPGWFPRQEGEINPYDDAIAQVGIGAFPMLPGQTGYWLHKFLKNSLATSYSETQLADRILAQDSVRIPPEGLRLSRGQEFVLVAPVGPGRTNEYYSGFLNGKAAWYHTREEALLRTGVPPNVMQDLTHCAIAVPVDGMLEIRYVYDVRQVERIERVAITADQAGAAHKDSTEPYWRIRLGGAIPVGHTIRLPLTDCFEFRITTTDDLLAAKDFKAMPWRYREKIID